MKSRAIAILIFASLVCAGFAPAFSQSAQDEAQFQRYVNAHPGLRADLRKDPNLVNDPYWLSKHQGFVGWLNQHPNMRNQAFSMGAYDNNHQWHNADWWHHNDPDWMYDHHPEWVRDNPAWRNDGDWDDQHHWHDRNWWVNNNHAWVEQHHPNWAEIREERQEEYQKHHPNWSENGENQPNYGESEGHHGNGHAYGHYKDHGDHGHGHGDDNE